MSDAAPSFARRVRRRLSRELNRRSFSYHKWIRYRTFVSNLPVGRTPLIVFQMGKVGSSSIVATLRAADTSEFNIFQVHFLSKPMIKRVTQQFRHASRAHGVPTIDGDVLESIYLQRLIERQSGGPPWLVISAVRDPIARNVSSFFQAFPIYFAERAAEQNDRTMSAFDSRELVELFLRDDRHHVPLNWFENHLQTTFGLDVYETPFDTNLGYQIYQNDRCRLLVLRLEDMVTTIRPALAEFIGLEVTGLARENVSADKDYSTAFNTFLDHLRLPDEYVAQMYDSRYARHFYSETQLQEFRKRWVTT